MHTRSRQVRFWQAPIQKPSFAGADPEAVVRDVAVRELHALREARGAARVLHVDDVVHVALGLAREVVLPRRLHREGEHLVERVHAAVLLAAEEHHALQVRVLRALDRAARLLAQLGHERVDHVHVRAVAVAGDDEEVLGVGLREREVHLVLFVVRVERQEDRADLGGREHEHHPVGHVRGPEGDLLAALHAEGHEAAREAVHLLAELVPGEAEVAVGVDDGVVLAAARDRLVEELPERVLARDGQVVPGHAAADALGERRLRGRRTEWVRELEHEVFPFRTAGTRCRRSRPACRRARAASASRRCCSRPYRPHAAPWSRRRR